MKKKNQPHDRFFKAAFSDTQLVKDFLIEFLPASVVKKIHFESLKLSNQSFITKELSAFYSDLVYGCNYGQDEGVEITLLFEHKSNVPPLPHLQLLRYMVEMWESQLKNKEEMKAVIPIVLYQGKKHWEYRDFWNYFQNRNQELLTYFPDFQYCLVDLSSISDEDLLAMQAKQLSFALYLMKQVSMKIPPEEFFRIAFHRVADGKENHLIISGIVYILQTRSINNEKLGQLLDTQPNQIKKMAMTTYDRWIKEGEEKGISLIRKQTVEVGYENGLSIKLIAKLTGLSEEEVQKMIAEISEKKN